jgi:Spx/MgsR family transcriptional regulator
MSQTPTLYGLPHCGTCRKALAWLEDRGIRCTFVDYRANPVSAAKLRAWARQIPWEKLVNRSGPTWRNLPEARKAPADDAAWVKLIGEFPVLLRRPVVEIGEAVSTGFSDKRFAALFGR